jgi:hypothetical protein
MISEIVSHTPVWVWAMLVFFIYRGVAASRDRDVPVWSLFILPVVLLGLSIQGMVSHYGVHPALFSGWLIAAVCGALIGARTLNERAVALGIRGVVMRGSWLPLILVLAVFLTKYCTEVLIALRPDLMLQGGAVLAVCVLYGLLTGFFLGRLGRALMLFRALAQTTPRAAPQPGQATA